MTSRLICIQGLTKDASNIFQSFLWPDYYVQVKFNPNWHAFKNNLSEFQIMVPFLEDNETLCT